MIELDTLVAPLLVPPYAVLLIPAISALMLLLIPSYRLGAFLNMLASASTLGAGGVLPFGEPFRNDILLVDEFNGYLVALTTFIAFTTSIFSAGYIDRELKSGRLTAALLRFYHPLYQAVIAAMNLTLLANNIGVLWIGLEVATLATVLLVGIYRTPAAVEAAWKYFILSSVGLALAFFGTILVYVVAQEKLGQGLSAMAWDLLAQNAGAFDPKLLTLAFIFLLVGYGTKAGLVPFHAWLPDAHAEGPTPVSALLSGLLLNVGLYALLRFKMLLANNANALNVGMIMIVLGLLSLVFAAFMLYRRRDIKRLFAYSSIEHMGIMAFAFGIGGPVANFAGLLHMTMHSLVKSAIFFAVGHVAQIRGTQRIADITGLSATNPVLAVGLLLGVFAIAGLPPSGVFTAEFMLVTSSFARQPVLAAVVVFGLIIAFGALILRLHHMLFGEPGPSTVGVRMMYLPLFLHVALVLAAGLWLPEPVLRWFRIVAGQLG